MRPARPQPLSQPAEEDRLCVRSAAVRVSGRLPQPAGLRARRRGSHEPPDPPGRVRQRHQGDPGVRGEDSQAQEIEAVQK